MWVIIFGFAASKEQEDEVKEELYEVGWGGQKAGIFLVGEVTFHSSNCEVAKFWCV